MTGSGSDLLINLLMLLALFVAIAGWWMYKLGSLQGKIAERVRSSTPNAQTEVNGLTEEAESTGFSGALLQRLILIGDKLPLFDAAYRRKLQKEMVRAGYRGRYVVSVLLAVKFCVGIIAAATTVLLGNHLPLVGVYPAARGVAMLFAFIVGMIIPEYVVAWRSKKRRNEMAGCLPDALDLLVICTNAGNSLTVSMRRVADELITICPPLADEFSLTADQLNLSGDVTHALEALAERIDLPAIRALIATLTQSMRYGTPITQSLRTLSRTERLAHIVSLEEKAAKLAPKMVLPMMVFILPPVIVIATGPSVIQILAMFRTL